MMDYMITNAIIIFIGIIACIGVLFLGLIINETIMINIRKNAVDKAFNHLTDKNLNWLIVNMGMLDSHHETTVKLEKIHSNIKESTVLSENTKISFERAYDKYKINSYTN